MNFSPTSQQERIEAVDSLRGFALLGVLFSNISYAGPATLPQEWYNDLNFLTHFLIERKFITMFSILFGFGFYIQIQRAKERNIHFTRYFLIRMGLLFSIGVIHSFGIWRGDILMAYAIGGTLLLLFHKLSVKRLFLLAFLFNVLLAGIFYIGDNVIGWLPYNYNMELYHEYQVAPSYSRYLTINFITNRWINFPREIPMEIVFTFGNMLIGLILGKVNFFIASQKAKRLSNYLIVLGGTLGLASSYTYHRIMEGDLELGMSFVWLPFVVLTGILLQSLMYMSLFVRGYQFLRVKKVLGFFNPVGRTSLTNYISQSIFYVLVLYHCTPLFQLYGKITMAQTYLLALGLYLVQTLMSYLWLRNNKQGPLETIWKRLSYNISSKTLLNGKG